MAMSGSSRPPANEPMLDASGDPTVAWGAFFQEVSDYLTDQTDRFAANEADIAALQATATALLASVATLNATTAAQADDIADLTLRVTAIETRLGAAGIP